MIKINQMVFLICLLTLSMGQLLSSAILTSRGDPQSSQYPVGRNLIGLSMQLPQLFDNFPSTLFQQYLTNSMIGGSWGAIFDQAVHTPVGYKYNCSKYDQRVGANTTLCTMDLNNQTLMEAWGKFNYEAANAFTSIGWDQQAANYSDTSYITDSLLQFFFAWRGAARQSILVELVDRGDKWGTTGADYDLSRLDPNLTNLKFIDQCDKIKQQSFAVVLMGPGITPNASQQWYKSNEEIYQKCGAFSLRCVIFPDPSLLTVDNLLSDFYTSEYIDRRMTIGGKNYVSDFQNYVGNFNDVRLVDDVAGVDGMTNIFAAAMWTVDFIMQAMFAGVFRLQMFNPMKQPSFQSILGQGPNFNPSVLYPALLFSILCVRDRPFILKPTMIPGTSSNIKIFGMDRWYTPGFLIMNKDTSPLANGYVRVAFGSTNQTMACFYFKADNMTSKSASASGMTWVGGKAVPEGVFESTKIHAAFTEEGDMIYQVDLNYSQAVYCEVELPQVDNSIKFKRGRSNGEYLVLGVLLLMIMGMM